MVVCGDTAGTVSRFRCIHLTVVRKHKQRLGQQSADCSPQAISAKSASSRRRKQSWPARIAISSMRGNPHLQWLQAVGCSDHVPKRSPGKIARRHT
ncbi:hypothetical protein AMECASPLE_015805 [Ameca splendens]|uniref:Uncharacterized protein n=1 Tax=Ameca splendens TaxID=208324 RepID=A0ABV0XF51_9TELE